MVHFLIGVVVLVWTLDDAVAIAVTILVAVFLVVVLVLTVLPVFVRRCPYRSPTAWACVRLADFVPHIFRLPTNWAFYGGRYIWYITLLVSDYIIRSQYIPRRVRRIHADYILKPYLFQHYFYNKSSSGKTWRTDGIGGVRRFDWDYAKLQLAREAAHLGPDGTFISEPDVDSVLWTRFYEDLTQSPALLRALQWVFITSPGDSQITACIDECILSVHPDRSLCTQRICQGVALTYLYPSQVMKEKSSRKYSSGDVVLRTAWSNAHTSRNLPQADPITCHRISLGVIAQLPLDKTQQVIFCLNTEFSLGHYCYTGGPQVHSLRLGLLAADLRSVITGNTGSSSDWIRDDSSLRRVFEWLSMMTALGYFSASFRLQADRYLDGLRSILNNEPTHETLLGSRAPGLRTLAFIVAIQHAKVSITENKSLGMLQLLSIGSLFIRPV